MNSGFCWTASRLLMTQRRPATPRNPERGPVEFSKWISSNLRASGHVIPCSQQKKNNQIRWHNLNQRPVSLGMVHGTLLYFQPSPMLMWKKTPERYLPSISTKTRPFCRLMIGARYEKTGEFFFPNARSSKISKWTWLQKGEFCRFPFTKNTWWNHMFPC